MDESLLVVIVNYGLSSRIERLLSGGAVAPSRVLLVDNASEPNQLKEVAERFGAQLLLLNRNYGFAGAVNRALAHAGPHREILLLNPDVQISGAQLEMLTLSRRDFTAVSPVLLNVDGTIQVGTAGGPLTWQGFGIYFMFVSHVFPRARGAFYTKRQVVSGLQPAWLCMACLLLDGDAFQRFGPIPEDEIVYGEDLAWGYLASMSGARLAIATNVRVVHEQGAAGASARSVDALARLAVRINGSVEGLIAVACLRLGLAIRLLCKRLVRGQHH